MRLLSLLLLVPLPGFAATNAQTAPGHALAVDFPCAAQVTIEPDPSLDDQVALAARADHPEEIAQLRLYSENDTAKLVISEKQCWYPEQSPGGFHRTLVLDLRIPVRSPISISDGGDATYVIGDVDAPANISLSGNIEITMGTIGPVNLEMNGTGHLRMASIAGPAHIELNGSADADIDKAAMPALSAELSGASTLQIRTGTVSTLSLDITGSAGAKIGAIIGTGAVEIAGTGKAELARVAGSLTRNISGTGTLTVQGE